MDLTSSPLHCSYLEMHVCAHVCTHACMHVYLHSSVHMHRPVGALLAFRTENVGNTGAGIITRA